MIGRRSPSPLAKRGAGVSIRYLMTTEPLPIVYCIDASDRIVHVNTGWIHFARHNHGGRLLPEFILGRLLWEHITDSTVQELYRCMVSRARHGQPTRFRFRCDAPHQRRSFQMTISPLEHSGVQFESHLEAQEPRDAIDLLDPFQARETDVLLRMCSWCHGIDWPGVGWLPLEEAVERLYLVRPEGMPRLTHGICRDCTDRVMRELGEE